MLRVRTQQKSKDHSGKKTTTIKARSQQVFERLKNIYGLKNNTQPSQPLVIGVKLNRPSPSPRKLTPNKLILHISEKSRTPQQKSQPSGFLTQRQKQKEVQQNAASARKDNSTLQELRKRIGGRNYKDPSQTQRFFRKQKEKNRVDTQMTETLRMVWEIKPKRPRYQFKMLKRLGKSQAGQILLALSNFTGIVLAMKTFRKSDIKLDFFIDESKIHFFCDHPNILPAYGLHIGRQQAYLMMEVGQGNLYDRIVRQAPFSQHTVAIYISQVASAVAYLHKVGVMHRDIKPENIIIFGNTLKLADFGWSIHSSRPRKTLCGTMDYISPEVVNRQFYSNKIDCWSIGVLMYEMLTGHAPFPDQEKNPNFEDLVLPKNLSTQGRDLIQKLLDKDPINRIPARDVLQHQWIKFHLKKQKEEEKKKFKSLQTQLSILFQ